MGEADEGDRGGVYGYPGGGDLRIAPYEIAREVEARGTDIYDDDQTVAQRVFLSAHLRPGDSGSALIDPTGSVVGVAFAIAPDRSNVAYALTVDELDAGAGRAPGRRGGHRPVHRMRRLAALVLVGLLGVACSGDGGGGEAADSDEAADVTTTAPSSTVTTTTEVPCDTPDVDERTTWEVTVAGEERTYLVDVPESYDGSSPTAADREHPRLGLQRRGAGRLLELPGGQRRHRRPAPGHR